MNLKVTVCGVGEVAHVLIGVLGAQPDVELKVLTLSNNETERLEAGLGESGGLTVQSQNASITGVPTLVSEDPSHALEGTQLFLLTIPASTQIELLRKSLPFLSTDCVIGALPARGGFNWAVQELSSEELIFFGLQTLPWICTVERFGDLVSIQNMKSRVGLAALPADHTALVSRMLRKLLRIPIHPLPNFLALTLANPEQILHPGVMFALFHEWDGQPFDQPPAFSEGLQNESASILLQGLSNEIQGIKASFQRERPHLDLSQVRTLRQWLYRFYPEGVPSSRKLKDFLETFPLFKGLDVPMLSKDGGYVPDFQSSFLAEDIPSGLMVSRGIAALMEVYTPTMDILIDWAQEKIGKFYIHDHTLLETDLYETRAPQRYGIHSREDLLKHLE